MTMVYSEWEELRRADDRIREQEQLARTYWKQTFPGNRMVRKAVMHEDWMVPCVEWQWYAV